MTAGGTHSATLQAHEPLMKNEGMRGVRLVTGKRDEVLFFFLKCKGSPETISISHQKVNCSVYLTERRVAFKKNYFSSYEVGKEFLAPLPPSSISVPLHVVLILMCAAVWWRPAPTVLYLRAFYKNVKFTKTTNGAW